MSARITTRPSFQADIPRPLFTDIEAGVSLRTAGPYWAPPYDVHPDGRRFVMIQPVGGTPKITVVENWIREFEGQK